MEVPGSGGDETENGPVRREAVLDNRVNLRVPFPGLAPGPHKLSIQAVDPGAVVDEITLP